MRIPQACREKGKGRVSFAEGLSHQFYLRIYNDVEFPTASAFGYTLAVAAVESVRVQECPRHTVSQGCKWKRLRLPASREAIGKEMLASKCPPVSPFLAISGNRR
jgi:hypothetical protein